MDAKDAASYADFLCKRRAEVSERLAAAARRVGRAPQEVTMLAVSKTVGPDEVALAWRAGWRAFGENRPQELKRKLAGAEGHPEMAGVRFDMVGNLQTNKINQVIGRVALIHSVSSLHLAQSISKRAIARDMVCKVLIEVNVSGEDSKSGFSPAEATLSMDELMALEGLSIEGLMTMAPAHQPDEARRTFSGLRELAESLRERTGLALGTLSCGMSDDFTIAVEEGSTLVRLGRVVFDPAYRLA